MDATIIEEPGDILQGPIPNIEPCTSSPVEDTHNTKFADFHGNERGTDSIYDALSAVKLDPAVIEAQITINGKQQKEAEPPHNPAIPATSTYCSVTSTKESPEPQPHLDFKAMVMRQEAALLSLTPQQLDLLMQFTDKMRRQRNTIQRQLECSFCKNNGESTVWYSSHCLKDGRGRVKCPVLRAYVCPVCAATGDRAHTITYCPEKITFDFDNRSDKGSL